MDLAVCCCVKRMLQLFANKELLHATVGVTCDAISGAFTSALDPVAVIVLFRGQYSSITAHKQETDALKWWSCRIHDGLSDALHISTLAVT